MHIYDAGKNNMKTANAVHYVYIYIYILLSLSFWINCIWLIAFMDYTANELWSGNGSIGASAHLQLISYAWVATLQWKPILCLLMIYMRSMFVWIQTLVSTCEECICVWAMGNDGNYYSAIGKEHTHCARYWHIIQYVILNYKLFLCIVVYMIFHDKSNDSFNIPLFLPVCVPNVGGLIICFHGLYHQNCRYCWCFQLKFLSWTNKSISRCLS